MSQVRERTTRMGRPLPDEAVLTDQEHGGPGGTVPRILGALAVLVVGGVHLEQYFAVHFDVVPIIGPLFALNFAGAMLIGIGLLVPPLRRVHIPLALGGIGLAATSFVFLFVSEHRTLFGFHDYGYRAAIVIALAAEAAAAILLAAFLALRLRRR